MKADAGLFSIAADYLGALPRTPHTALLLQEVLTRQPLDSEVKAAKLIALADRLDAPEAARSLRVVMGMQCYAQRRYRAAIHWLLLAKDPLRVSQLAKQLLRRHIEELSGGGDAAAQVCFCLPSYFKLACALMCAHCPVLRVIA